MSQLVVWEAGYLGTCFLLGILLMLLYDVIRIGRIVVPHHGAVTGAEDLLYWLTVAAAAFLMLYKGNDGIIRWYAVAAIAAGMLVFNAGISRFTVPLIGKMIRLPLEMLGKGLKSFYKTVTIGAKKIGTRWLHGRAKMEKKEKK